jgi:citryl-CoA lyase
MTTDRTGWSTAVGDVGEGRILVRGYPLVEIIRHMPFSAATYMTIRGEFPSPSECRVMDAVLCAILEHGFYAPTTVVARMVASASPENIMSGVAAALLTVGSITVSPQHSAELAISAIQKQESSGLTASEVAADVVADLIKSRVRMPGLGHPLHPDGDPRASALREVAIDNGVWGRYAEMFELLSATYCEQSRRRLPVNIDGMLSCVMMELGFTPLEMPGIAAISFMPGIVAHAVEEINSGLKLRVVEGSYEGAPAREVPSDLAHGRAFGWEDRS